MKARPRVPLLSAPGPVYLVAVAAGTVAAAAGAIGAAILLMRLGIAPTTGSIGWALSVSVSSYAIGFVSTRRLLGALARRFQWVSCRRRRIDDVDIGRLMGLVVPTVAAFGLAIGIASGVTLGEVKSLTVVGGHPRAIGLGEVLEISVLLGLVGHVTLVVMSRLPVLRRSQPAEGDARSP